MEREEILKITEEGGRRESGDGGEGGASWELMMMSSTGLGGCRSALLCETGLFRQSKGSCILSWAVAVEYWDHVARLIPISPFL